MEENRIENIQNTPVEQTVPITSNMSVTQNMSATPVAENKSNNKKTIISIMFAVTIMLITIGVVLIFLSPNENKQQEKKPEEILASLGITDYFKYILTTDYEKGTNLLDINNEEQMFMYYYYNKNTKIYKIDFQDPTFEGNLFLTYAKYDDYMEYHEKVFGEKSKHEMSIYDVSLEKIKSVGNDVYQVIETLPIQCRYAENTDNCYLKLTKDIEDKGDVILSNIEREGNIITGTATYNSKTEHFEFAFEEVNDEMIIKALKIIDNLGNN